ncbi:retrovirus-related pol polyprotein from transposon TNT 1-94 [Tanacetum coccineum]
MSRKLGVKCSTSNCGSKPPGNKRNDRISQTPSRNKKNKVEAQPRKVNKINRVDVQHSLSNANSEILCATCNKSMCDGVHDKCLLDLVQNGNNPCTLGKSKKSSYQPKDEDTNQEKLYLLHMDLCGLMRVASINGKRYILVIVDDYSRFTWVRFLKTKDEALAAIIKNIQVRLNATVWNVRTDNGTEFVNQTLREFYENVGISHQNLRPHSLADGVVRKAQSNSVEAARYNADIFKSSIFLGAEAINTACYTQNHSLIRLRYNNTPYELMQDKKPDLSFLHVLGSLCYPTNDYEDLEGPG